MRNSSAESRRLLAEAIRHDAFAPALTPIEQSVVRLFVDGFTYSLIGERLGLTPKQVDNALQRVRAKALFKAQNGIPK